MRVENYIAQGKGRIEVFVANESGTAVWFDEMSITHTPTLIAQETHYDPWGLELVGIGAQGFNRFTFNKQSEKQKELGGNKGYFFETDWRGYDPQTGRFWQIDKLAGEQHFITPYHFGYNNPISMNDPSGLKPPTFEEFLRDVYANSKSGTKYNGKDIQKAFQKTQEFDDDQTYSISKSLGGVCVNYRHKIEVTEDYEVTLTNTKPEFIDEVREIIFYTGEPPPIGTAIVVSLKSLWQGSVWLVKNIGNQSAKFGNWVGGLFKAGSKSQEVAKSGMKNANKLSEEMQEMMQNADRLINLYQDNKKYALKTISEVTENIAYYKKYLKPKTSIGKRQNIWQQQIKDERTKLKQAYDDLDEANQGIYNFTRMKRAVLINNKNN